MSSDMERLFRSVLDRLPDAIEIIDRNFNVLYLNAAAEQRTGQGIREQKGKKCHEVFYNRSQPCAFCPALKTFETGEPGYVLLRDVQVRSAEPCSEELLSLPLRTDRRGVQWVVEIAKDVTKEKELEQQLINSERLISFGEVTAAIAHEFNNPLGIIIGFAQDLLTEVEPSDPRYQSLKIIEEEAGRCKKIMRDLLEFGRPNAAHLAPTQVEEVIRKGMGLVSAHLQQSDVKVIVEVETDLPRIYADAQQLCQVLVNLFFNAIEAMPEGGTLTVRAGREPVRAGESGTAVTILVADTGEGIDPADLPKIFRPFFTTKKKKGMGLGLSICESIVKAHGGGIDVESAPGLGTTFRLRFPVVERRDELGS